MRKDIFILAQKTMTTCFFWFFRTKRIFFNGVKDIFSWANNVLSPATIPSYQRFLENQNLISLRLKYQFSIFFLSKNIIRISITLLTTLKHPIINIKTQKKKTLYKPISIFSNIIKDKNDLHWTPLFKMNSLILRSIVLYPEYIFQEKSLSLIVFFL